MDYPKLSDDEVDMLMWFGIVQCSSTTWKSYARLVERCIHDPEGTKKIIANLYAAHHNPETPWQELQAAREAANELIKEFSYVR